MRTGFTVPNDTADYLLRKAMRLYAEHDYKTDDATIEAIAAELHRKPKTVRELLQAGMRNMQFVDFYRSYADEEGEESAEDVTCDYGSEPSALFFKDELAADLYEAFQSLEYRERDMLSKHLGFCPECFSTRYADKNDLDENGKPKEKPIKPLPYTDIATNHGFSDADTAKRVCERAIAKLKKSI